MLLVSQRSYIDATRDGDVETLRQVLSDPKNSILRNVNILDEKKLTPLHYAARHSNIEAMKILVEHGADVNKLGDDDMTPLHYGTVHVFTLFSTGFLTRVSTELSKGFSIGFLPRFSTGFLTRVSTGAFK